MGAGVLGLLIGGTFLLRTVSGSGANLVSRPSVEHTRPLTTVAGTLEPAFSPDGNSVAFIRQGMNGIFVTSIGSNQFVQLTHDEDTLSGVVARRAFDRVLAFRQQGIQHLRRASGCRDETETESLRQRRI